MSFCCETPFGKFPLRQCGRSNVQKIKASLHLQSHLWMNICKRGSKLCERKCANILCTAASHQKSLYYKAIECTNRNKLKSELQNATIPPYATAKRYNVMENSLANVKNEVIKRGKKKENERLHIVTNWDDQKVHK
ncbi:hypothetical protein POVWA2_049060 [Plasmodium ovale wallikeri]|uniref:Uncharacterized protein n=1 Tax=Plasmodium ovale wallikeri TaxID=864142 RepID=A0A1A8ZME0_PLAOA|nr:hypothetical protein POVWA1_050040 [Plasmodium ovale wallikeri]SBT45028.1 hypothetical protein POVWA2_049060 [Plasmodium ovale wallikeri]